MTVDDSTATSPGMGTRSVVIAATVVLVATLAAIWWLVVPMEVVCPAIYPAPPGCGGAERRPAGVTWTGIVAAVYALSVVVASTWGRRRRWLTRAAMLVLVLVAIAGIGAVRGSAGSVTGY
ncbi:hypothetical protein FE251_04630 [Georgenia wutianyii]|uniref:Transmembrane protein n=1 Tax=Georgenia wutianyii TaxID=2585135 RepID=A0ABX5VLT9_9MICO|nr:hypothetical protein [Georgenia wutianyii]QDB78741.1 hypothetical protein FE251_04630 [Georgenia wutianyii]